ncbi:hypothetical protein [Paenibacillus methanolicus]|uniref:Uncharacterized protein n=1 Tax=Paenibacillus methanolicus TaxID=582686 RepID=A0A5S5BUX2_9BACL|nr:hypothetical protein [Paenibacillus methanolicus]TYP70128.1 hypothetical protein BCM02_112106 [Paenibacillus methanolicus]
MTMIGVSRGRLFGFLTAACLVLLADWFAIRASAADDRPFVAFGVLFDAALTVPLLYYFLVVRRRGGGWKTVLPAAAVALLAAWFMLPPQTRDAVWLFEAVLLPLEIAIIAVETRFAWRIVCAYREERRRETDGAEAIRAVFRRHIGDGGVKALLRHETIMYYYAFFSWGRNQSKRREEPHPPAFTYGEGSLAATITFVVIVLADTAAMHLLIGLWSDIAAWVTSLLNLWLLILLVADYRASRLQKVTIAGGTLRIRYGLKLQADIPLAVIASAQAASEFQIDRRERRASAEGATFLQPPNVRIELAGLRQVEGMLGLPSKADKIYLAMDQPRAFVEELKRHLPDYEPHVRN